jgi:anti-sigma regulatory factor (Ser/Thr protein kinase)
VWTLKCEDCGLRYAVGATTRDFALMPGVECRRCGGSLAREPDDGGDGEPAVVAVRSSLGDFDRLPFAEYAAPRRERGPVLSPAVVYERALPAVPSSVARFEHELDAALTEIEVEHDRCAQIAQATSEAVADVVTHAMSAVTPVNVHAGTNDRQVTVTVSNADGSERAAARWQLRYGLALMIASADAVKLTKPPATTGTHVTATFADAAPGPTRRTVNRTVRRAILARRRAAELADYASALAAGSETLAVDNEALRAEAHQALARARELRDERARVVPA